MKHDLGLLLRVGAAVVVLAAGVSPPVYGQVRVRASQAAEPATPGWIGISFEVLTDGRGQTTDVIVVDVSPGSPAQRAGIQPGDRVLVINDLRSTRELASLSERLHLKPGDVVRIDLERDGRRQQLELHADRRPESVATGTMLAYGSDAMVETWYQAMDSLRVEIITGSAQIVTGSGQNVRIIDRGSPDDARRAVENARRASEIARRGAEEARVRVVTSRDGVLTVDRRGPVQAPFEFFVFRGETHDSLREEMVEVNQLLSELDYQLRERQREVSEEQRRNRGTALADDVEFRRLSAARTEASVRSEALVTAMAEAARATAGLEYMSRVPGVGSTTGNRPVSAVPEREEFRPLTPYLLGRNRVAGAEVVEVKPEMAPYFGVQGGVLITEVVEGTPASMAGLLPGDVITHIDRVVVRSVEAFRFGVSQGHEALPITLVRRGAAVQLLLPR